MTGEPKRAETLKKAMAAKVASDTITALTLQLADLTAANLKVTKPKILDSGANVSVISDITHVNANTISLCRRVDDDSGAETADGAIMPIT